MHFKEICVFVPKHVPQLLASCISHIVKLHFDKKTSVGHLLDILQSGITQEMGLRDRICPGCPYSWVLSGA